MNEEVEKLKALHELHRTGRYSKLGIAIALGVNRRTVRRWFQGKHPPTERHQKLIKDLVQQMKSNNLPKESE